MDEQEIQKRDEYIPVYPVPTLSAFYRDKTLFITGFTGFLAQGLVEKLLWSFPDIKRFYILIRGKRNLSPEDRLQKLIQKDCFTRLRERGDTFMSKLIPIDGDLTKPNLGISDKDRLKLNNEVDVVIHSAATVNFVELLTSSMDINIVGTKSLLELATHMSKLQVFVHVSTAYTNCINKNDLIEELMYEPYFDWKTCLNVREKIDTGTINILSSKLLDEMPNTYTFTKNIAEHMVYKYADNLPIVIARPSIVSQALYEPYPGWCCSINGPPGISLGYSTGLFRATLCSLDKKNDFIPCDVVNKAIIFAIALKPHQRKDLKPIYHLTSRHLSISNEEFFTLGCSSVDKNPPKLGLWKPHTTICGTNYTKFYTCFILFQMFPAILVDLILLLIGQKPRLCQGQKKIYNMILQYAFFLNNNFNFDNSNCYFINTFLRNEDIESMRFAYKKHEIDYFKHVDDCVHYVYSKFLKQKPEDAKQAQILSTAFRIADFIMKYGFLFCIGLYIYNNELLPNFLSSSYNFLTNFSFN